MKMIKFRQHLDHLCAVRNVTPDSIAGCWRDIGGGRVEIDTAHPDYPLDPNAPKPTPIDQWPEWTREWVAQRTGDDEGLGDTLARIGTPMAKAVMAVASPGTCSDRRLRLNRAFPYLD